VKCSGGREVSAFFTALEPNRSGSIETSHAKRLLGPLITEGLGKAKDSGTPPGFTQPCHDVPAHPRPRRPGLLSMSIEFCLRDRWGLERVTVTRAVCRLANPTPPAPLPGGGSAGRSPAAGWWRPPWPGRPRACRRTTQSTGCRQTRAHRQALQ